MPDDSAENRKVLLLAQQCQTPVSNAKTGDRAHTCPCFPSFPIPIEKALVGLHGPKIAVGIIEEVAVRCWEVMVAPDGRLAQFARAPGKKAGSRSHKKSIKLIALHVGV
jgi:hypothetical protein